MNKIMIATLVAMSVSLSAQAQRKGSAPAAAAPAPVFSSGGGQNEVTALLGFASGAANIGVDYAHMNNGAGFGGYFFMQMEKETDIAGTKVKMQYQNMSFGGFYKMNVVDTNRVTGYFAPGFGISMVKEIGPITGTATKGSDETLFGASFKFGAQIKVTPTFAIGLERTMVGNWFNDKVSLGSGEYTSVAGTFAF